MNNTQTTAAKETATCKYCNKLVAVKSGKSGKWLAQHGKGEYGCMGSLNRLAK